MGGGGGEDSFIAPLGLLLGSTALVALLLSYIKQSTIIAFIAVGVAVSSFGVQFETKTLGHISEVGILILLFMAGLEVELDAFLRKWKTVTIVGVGQIVFSTGFFALSSFVVLPAIGAKVNTVSAVYFGLCMCFSSTILVLGYLKNSKSMGTVYGQLCLGTLVLQDAASVLGIAALGGLAPGVGTCAQADPVDCQLAGSGAACEALGSKCVFANTTSTGTYATKSVCADACASLDLSTASDGGLTMCNAMGSTVCMFQDPTGGGVAVSILVLFGKLIAAMFICFLLERYVLHKMFEAFARSLELLYLGALGYATGLAGIAVTAGFSGEITAFLAGVSIAQLPYKMHIETKMEPIKSLGVAIFFISLGLQLEVDQQMVESLPIGFGLAIFTLFTTLPLFMILGVLAKLKAHNVFMLGLLMNQISEFSLILCTLCVRAEVLEPIVLTVVTVAAVVSIIVSSIGHTFIDAIYRKIQRWPCLLCIDAHHRRGFTQDLENMETKEVEITEHPVGVTADADNDAHPTKAGTPVPLRKRPMSIDAEDWAFEDQLIYRSTEQLEIDRKDTRKELQNARESMAATANEKRLHPEKTKKQLYGNAESNVAKGDSRGPIIKKSHATDIRHGMIEGYVIIDRQMMFCTVRAGRMLFWRDKHDVGIVPPMTVWDISGMTILQTETKDTRATVAVRKNAKEPEATKRSSDLFSDSFDYDDEEVYPWEWTIVLGHIHRSARTSSIEEDTMKLAIHGLEGHSDHDAQDWQDALSVATAMLNSIALRLAHIREEMHSRRSIDSPFKGAFEGRKADHNHRNKIICIGYNNLFPAVLALADKLHKDVVVVEYDPMKINTVNKLYNEEKRRQDFKGKKSNKNPMKAVAQQRASTTDEIAEDGDVEKGRSTARSKRLRSTSMPLHQIGRAKQGFWAPQSDLDEQDSDDEVDIKGVTCEYADIHDPECWDELEMDQAFMLVVTIKGARHAEKAIIKWLKKHNSDTIFIAFTQNNADAIKLYKAGAHFVMQSDALAMRSTRKIFLETVADVGDCSQLVSTGRAHRKRLIKMENENNLKFQYETG